MEVALEGEDIGGKECFPGKRFKRRVVTVTVSICEDYNFRVFLLDPSRLTRKEGSKSCRGSRIIVLI
jgi:hypothetical protein